MANTSNPLTIQSGTAVELLAQVDDADGTVQAAEYFVGTAPAPGAGTPMDPVDGTFDGAFEMVMATVTPALTTPGTYTISVRGRDNAGNWGTPATVGVTVTAGPPTQVGLTASKNTINTDGADTVTLTATLLDAGGNTVTGQTPDVTVALSDATYATLDQATKAIDSGTGTVTFTLTSTGIDAPAGSVAFTATASSAGLTDSAAVTITAQNDVLNSITIAPTSATVKVGGATADFMATGNYQTAGPVDITTQVAWTVTAGTGTGTITQGADPAVFTGTAQGTATVQAELGGVSSNIATVTIQAPDALVFSCAAIPAIRLGESYDLSGAVSGGIPAYSYAITAGPANVGNLASSVFEVVDNTTFAGTYTVEVSDSAPTPQTQTCQITVPLALTPAQTSVVEGGAPTTITIKGVPADVTGFDVTLPSGAAIPADYGTFTVTPGSPNTTVQYAPPAGSDTVTLSRNFIARFTAVVGALAGSYVENQNRMTALIDYTATVTDGTTAIDGATVTALFDPAKTATTDVNGLFTIPNIEVTATTYGFSLAKTGYVSQVVNLSDAQLLAGDDVVLTPIGTVAGTVSGTVTLTDGFAPGFVQLSLQSGDDPSTMVPVTVGGSPLITFPDPTTGVFSFEVPDGFGNAALYMVTAEKFGYIMNSVTAQGPLDIIDVNVGIAPVTALTPTGNHPAGTDMLFLSIGASPAFTGAPGEIGISGDYSTGNFGFDGANWTINSPVQPYDTDPVDLAIQAGQTIRYWCYVDGQSDAVIQEILNPSANGGTLTTPRGVTVTLPPGGLIGQARERVTMYAVDALPEEAYGTTLEENQLIGGPAMVEIVLIGEDRQPVPDAEIDRVIIEMPYDPAIPSQSLLDGIVPIFKVEGPNPDGSLHTDTLCDMVASTGGMAVVPKEQIISVSGGKVTFWVDSLSAFGIARPNVLIDPPQLGAPTPSIDIPITGTQVTLTLVSGQLSKLFVDGVDTFFELVPGTSPQKLTFILPAGSLNGSPAIQGENATGFKGNIVRVFYATSGGGGNGGVITPPTPLAVDFEVVGFEDQETVQIPAGTTLEFRDLSSVLGLFSQYKWDFKFNDPNAGPEYESTERNPTFTFSEPGIYAVRLEVSELGRTGSMIKEGFIVVAGTGLTAGFSAGPATSGCAPLTVAFTDTTSGNVQSRVWLIDGQSEGTTSPFTTTFDTPGVYEVVLQVTGSDGAVDSSDPQTITVQDCSDLNFTFEIQPAPDCRTVAFTQSGNIQAQVWQFDDGNISAELDPVHEYAADGTYQVTLNAVMSDMTERTVTKTVTIACDISGTTIDAAFTADPTSGVAPLTVSFTDQSTATNGITSRTWDFNNDGTVDSTNTTTPVFVYDNPGNYTAVLRVQGPDGSDSANVQITVRPVISDGINPPVGRQPVNGAVDVGLNPVLVIDPYNDPDNAYGATQWEIATDPGFAEMFVIWRQTKNSGTDDDFMLEIPDFILEDGPATYYWRVRFIDAGGAASAWAGPYSFSTVAIDPEDQNDDGVPDDQEVDDPAVVFPGLDPNDPLILFVRAAMGDGYWALVGLDNVAELVALRAYTTDAEGVTVPPDTDMPLGLIGYKLVTFNPGDEARVRVYFNPAAPENAAWFSFLGVDGWQEFTGSTAVFGEDMASVLLTLKDGGTGDIDGIENGIIVVPLSGFGVVTPGGCVDCDGGSDTCFIDAAAQSFGGWSLLTFAALAVGGLVGEIRRRR